jgi:hypothetical protein
MLLRWIHPGFTLFVGLTILLVAAKSTALEEDERERNWSGPPQAIGIDLSPTFMQAKFPLWMVGHVLAVNLL